MTNPSNQTNPLDYPRYVRGIRPSLPNSMGDYVDTEFEKVQNSMENMAVAADANTKTQVADLKVTVDQNTADITTEQTARINADDTLASQINTVQATANGKNTIYWQSTAPTGGTYQQGDLWIDISNSNQLNTWDPTANAGAGGWVLAQDQGIPTNAAAITSEQNARISGDQANATSISNLTTTVNGNTASITTLQSSVNGLEAQYGVELNVNGYVTGFVQNNNGTSGSFIIQADKFALVPPGQASGSTGTIPFQIVNGVTYIDNAMIHLLQVDKLADGTLGANVTQNGDWKIGTGHIIFDNGTFMRVQGVGFGTTQQFIDWFGPSATDLSTLSETNAVFYLKTDGSAYFGGALSAGTISNSGQTTLSTATQFDLGPFSSAGHNITAEFTGTVYAILAQDSQTWIVGDTPPPDPYANSQYTYSITYLFEKSADGTNYTTIGTYTETFQSQSVAVSAGVDGQGNPLKRWEQVYNHSTTRSTTINIGSVSTAHTRITRTDFHDTATNTQMTPGSSTLALSTTEQ